MDDDTFFFLGCLLVAIIIICWAVLMIQNYS